jgi:hypothetical protein
VREGVQERRVGGGAGETCGREGMGGRVTHTPPVDFLPDVAGKVDCCTGRAEVMPAKDTDTASVGM